MNGYRRDSTSSSSLTPICQRYSALFISKIRKRILKMEIQEREKKKISGAPARKAVLFPCKWKMTKSRDAQKQPLDPIFSCQDWVTVYEASPVDLVFLVSVIIGLIIHSKDAPPGILGWLISKSQQSKRQTEAPRVTFNITSWTLHQNRPGWCARRCV